MNSLISSNVDVSPNEYITRYAFNRNFLKLIENDLYLNGEVHKKTNKILTYNKNKTYSEGDLVFYKINPDSMLLYLLKCKKNGTSHKPLVMNNNQGEKVVINSDDWKIVGIPSDNFSDYRPTQSPISYALEYTEDSKRNFNEIHQENTNDNAHPTGKLGIDESTKLFRNFSNISSERNVLHYPYHMETLPSDNTIQHGVLRKWENGLLEYDVVYRLGYQYTDDDGKDILCANTLSVTPRNNNYLYFKNNNDYKIFCQGGNDFVTTKTTKQYNLNSNINSYSGQINFPIPFKDLNYTIFTSNVKNVETDSKTAIDNYIERYDNRLIIEGSNVVGYKSGSSFKYPLYIPNKVTTIAEKSMSFISETDGYEVVIDIDKDGNLNSMDRYAFQSTEIRHITIGRNVRHIGEYAFSNCYNLSSIDIYVYDENEKQLKMDQNAFESTQISEINVHYEKRRMRLGISESDRDKLYLSDKPIEEKLKDITYMNLIGINTIPKVNKIYDDENNKSIVSFSPSHLFSKNPFKNTTFSSKVPNEKISYGSFSYGEYQITDIIKYSGNMITGYDQSMLTSNIDIDLADMPDGINEISPHALSKFEKLSSISIPQGYLLGANSFEFCSNLKTVSIDMNNSFICENCFYIDNIDSINVRNILNSRTSEGQIPLKGFGLSSFYGCTVDKIVFPDIDYFNSISSFFCNDTIGKNVTKVGTSTVIQTNHENRIVRNTQEDTYYEQTPSYLVVDGSTIVGCNFNILCSDGISKIIIPSGYDKINDNVFSPQLNGFETSSFMIGKINIPNTIRSIGKNAFYNLSTLINLDFETGCNVDYIGTNMVYGCTSLNELVIN